MAPRPYSFYDDLDSTSIRFPTVTSSALASLKGGEHVYYKLFGNQEKARVSTCPPTTMDFYLVTTGVMVDFWTGFWFGVCYIPIALLFNQTIYTLIQITSEQFLHYWVFGPFAIILLVYDLIYYLVGWLWGLCGGEDDAVVHGEELGFSVSPDDDIDRDYARME